MLNYNKLMNHNPSEYESFVNSKGQNISFVEHPIVGDEYPIICVCHDLKLACSSDFFETDDMLADHKEYEPSFENGNFYIGEFQH
tara:strand:- start:603 stop:857 length:255 start_codon:yes stop_codon:yes gene_type:complete